MPELRLISDGIYGIATRFKQGELRKQMLPSGWRADHPSLTPFLTKVLAGDETEAINALAFHLIGEPTALWHPYAQEQFRHLCAYVWAPRSAPMAFRRACYDALSKLVAAWAQGMSRSLLKLEK